MDNINSPKKTSLGLKKPRETLHRQGKTTYLSIIELQWKYAKQLVQCSDINIHENGYHLTNTHLLMEAIITGTREYLSAFGNTQAHFLFELLEPHFKKTLSLNFAARETLIPTLARISGTNSQGIKILVDEFWNRIDFTDMYPTADLTRRGMIDMCSDQNRAL